MKIILLIGILLVFAGCSRNNQYGLTYDATNDELSLGKANRPGKIIL